MAAIRQPLICVEQASEPRAAAAPAPPPHAVLALQRAAGNRAVAALLQRERAPADAVAAETAHAKATEGLDRDRKRLLQALADGKRQKDTMLVSSIEWIETGTLGVRLYAVRQTGDTEQRAPRGKAAFFPKASEGDMAGDVRDPTLPGYNWRDLDDNTGVAFNTPTAGGWNSDGKQIAIEVGDQAQVELFKAIKHEVQHAADRNHVQLALITEYAGELTGKAALNQEMAERGEKLMGEGTMPLGVEPESEEGKSRQAKFAEGEKLTAQAEGTAGLLSEQLKRVRAAKAFEHYKTEYRAYSYMGEAAYEKLDVGLGLFTSAYEGYGFEWSPRQAAILERILKGYPEIADQFEKNVLLPDERRFREAVHAYRLPDEEGFNKLNSMRVNAFYEAVRRLPRDTSDPKDESLTALLGAIGGLKEDEASYLANDKEAVAMGKLMREKLAGKALDVVRQRLRERIPLLKRPWL